MILEKARMAVADENELLKIKNNIADFYQKHLSYECFRRGILKI